MKIQSLKCWLVLFVFALFGLSLKNQAFGQSCFISFSGPAGNVLTSFIDAQYPNYPNSDAYFNIMVQDSNEAIPIGTYLAWCVDAGTLIDPSQNYTAPGTLYSGVLLPTCDTNLNNELPPGHSATSYVSPAVWQEVNYILNHKNGAYFWDIQVAINDLVGGPAPGPSPPYPPFDPTIVQSLLDNASNNAAAWIPQCGDVIGAVYVITNQTGTILSSPVQLLMLEIPYCCVTFSNCPPNIALGCNPAPGTIPDVDLTSVYASSSCGYPVTITGSKSDSTLNCAGYRILTYTASDAYGNTATCSQTITWTVDTNAPVILTSLTNSNLGCNPATLPTIASVAAQVTAVDGCSSSNAIIVVTNVDGGSPCAMTRTFIIIATDGCGNSATNNLVYTWTVDTNAPSVTVPANSNLGCNPAILPTDASVAALVAATDNCTLQSTNVTHVDGGSACSTNRTFTVTVTDGCGNTSTPQTVVYTWTVDTNAPTISVPPGGNLGCNPTTLPTDASVKTNVTMTDDCTLQSNSVSHVDSVTSCGVTRTFTITATDACGNTAKKTVVYTWTTDTNAPVIVTSLTNANLGCNPATLPTVASVTAKVSAVDTCSASAIIVTSVDGGSPCAMTRTFTITTTNACGYTSAPKTVVYTWTVDLTAPTIIVPPGANLFCNPTILPTDASVKALVNATDNCTIASTNVSHLDLTNGCTVTRTFTITAADACGNVSTNKTVYTWTADTTPPVITCPPDITISNNVVPYCTFAPCDYAACCTGTNVASILNLCFNKIYPGGYVQCGNTNTSYWIKFTSCSSIQKFASCSGTPNCLKGNYSNPTSCEAGSFGGQALCLKLNVDLGDYCKSVTGLTAGCGDLVLNDSTSPLNGKSIRQILGICNTALGGGSISSYGCTISNLNVVCSNLNLSFENCKPSSWCQSHLAVTTITNVSPKVTGYATVLDKCSSTPTLTYSDVTTAGTCSGAYVIARTWVALDGCGNSNYCTQKITVGVPKSTVCVTGPCSGKYGQTVTYSCCVTNTGSTCFSACKVSACGKSFTCPALNPGQGCSFTFNYQYQSGDVGTYKCQATASCTYSTSSSPCTSVGTCSTTVTKW